jgi:hypothetical protein
MSKLQVLIIGIVLICFASIDPIDDLLDWSWQISMLPFVHPDMSVSDLNRPVLDTNLLVIAPHPGVPDPNPAVSDPNLSVRSWIRPVLTRIYSSLTRIYPPGAGSVLS